MKKIRPLLVPHFLFAILLFLLAGCAKSPASTPPPQPTRDLVLEQSFTQELSEINLNAVPAFQQATRAMDFGNADEAKGLYQQVIMLAPNFSTAYRRLGSVEVSLGNLEIGEGLVRKALEIDPNGYNQAALATMLLQKDTPTPEDVQEAFTLASAAAQSLPDDEQANIAWLMSAGAVEDITAMRKAVGRLLYLAPNNPITHYYASVLAAYDGKWEEAEREMLLSGQLGMPAEVVQGALETDISRNVIMFRALYWGGGALAIWLLGFLGIFLLGSFLSHATMQALNKTQPAASTQVAPEEHRIRSVYRVLINVLSLYFYISIPFVILLLILVVGGAFYLFLSIGRLPVQLALILALMLLASLFAISRALFSRMRDTLPGRPVQRADAPELWQLVEDVARKLGTRPIDAIYVTPGVDIAVYEKGSILQKLRGGSRRNLILGMGVLPALTQGQLAAILAHEYGHFSNQDTAGGDMAYQVQASLQQLAERLAQGGAAQVYNPVWLFVMVYHRIFLRVTLGASRLQEVLADRYAAIAYGSQNFIEGLRAVIRQGIAFPLRANHELRESFERKQSVHNLYDLPSVESLQGELDKQLDEIMMRPTSVYDSHPAPQERIKWVERLQAPHSARQNDSQSALKLFPNPEAWQLEMTAQVMKNLQAQQGV